MEGVDPDTLLEWLQTGVGEERDLQMMALEQLCMTLLMSDNIDRCFESCPPRTFLPALGRIFLDETAPDNILEVTARAITYYLDVSNECTRRITQVEGAIKAICHRLIIAEMNDRTSKDLAEQCVKLLEHICQREASAVYDAGGLQAMLHLIRHHDHLHKDTMHSAMAVITKLCSKIEPHDANLAKCSEDLGDLLGHDDERVAECALRCFAAMTDRFIRRQMDPVELARPSNLVAHLFDFVSAPSSAQEAADSAISSKAAVPEVALKRNTAFVTTVLSLFANLCKTSSTITEEILSSPKLVSALKVVLNSKDERCINDCLRLIDLLIVLLCEGRASIPKHNTFSNDSTASPMFDKTHRNLIDAIRLKDTDALIDAVENGTVDPNFVDDVGQTLLNWCSAFGTTDMVIYLCDKGADPNKGQRSSSLHYASCFGRAEVVKILLRYGASPDLQDEEGRTALDKARERSDEGHQQVCEILQNPGAYMNMISSAPKTSPNAPMPRDEEKEKIDEKVAEKFIQQLLPLFCVIFKNSMAVGIRRTTLTLIRKCVSHISNKGLTEIAEVKENIGDNVVVDAGNGNIIELLIGVLMLIFESVESNNMESKEQALMTIKSLLSKNPEFWTEQLIRLGVYEKIEQLTIEESQLGNKINLTEMEPTNSQKANILENLERKEENVDAEKLTASQFDRSENSTPSVSLRSDSTVPSNEYSTPTEQAHYSNDDIVVNADSATPSPTVEILPRQTSASTAADDENRMLEIREDLPAFDSDLVEAATTIANALGVQIVHDVAENSAQDQQPASKDGSDDVWTVEEGVFYRWKDWRLIRAKESLFVWCDAVALELSDGSNGWLRFLMNGRLSTLYSSGSPEYGADNADTRAEFIEKLQKAKSTVPSGAQTKPLLSIPRAASQKIESGNWSLASVDVGALVLTNREGTQQKLVIKEDLPGFIFESSRHHKQIFTADSTLGHDFVTGWAARGGGRRLRYFRLEVQRQKVYDLAKEIWDNYLKEARDRPREVVLEIQKCAEKLKELTDGLKMDQSRGGKQTEMVEGLREVLAKIRDSIIDEQLLSVFEISVSGLVPSLLEFLKLVQENKTDAFAECFAETFADPKHLGRLVNKIVLVLEYLEKFPQYLYDSPGGSPFGFQLLTRRLRFRFELDDESSGTSKEFTDITNRSLKSEPLVTVASLKAYLYEHITRPSVKSGAQPGTSSSTGLPNLHYEKPPTAASLRVAARKLPKCQKSVTGPPSSSSDAKHCVPNDAVLSARSAYMAAGCLEKVGGSIKVKQTSNAGKATKNVLTKKGATASRPAKTAAKSQRSVQQKEIVAEQQKPSAETGGGISQQQQKSMSTTNLFDAERRKTRSSSVAFNQAASAESLQHQTPSLENLLSKARLHDYSIPEESMGSPNSGSPEPKNLPTFDDLPHFETRFEKRKGSEDAQSISVGASSFVGGSQPVLNSSSFASRAHTANLSAEKLGPSSQVESSIETINEESRKAENDDELQMQYSEKQLEDAIISLNNEYPAGEEEQAGDEYEEDEIMSRLKAGENIFNLLIADEPREEEGEAEDNVDISSKRDDDAPEANMVAKAPPLEGSEAAAMLHESHLIVGGNSNTANSHSQQIHNIGSNIRVKLGSYAEVLRNMMQQVLETGEGSDIYDDVDEFDENEIYEDELQYIEAECEPIGGGGFSLSSDSTSIAERIGEQPMAAANMAPIVQQSGGSNNTAANMINDATAALQSQIESFTSVASALRRQFSSSSSTSSAQAASTATTVGSSRSAAVAAIRAAMERSDSIFSAIPVDAIIGGAGEQRKHRWRQMLLEEFSSSNAHQTAANNNGGSSKQMRTCDTGCPRAIRMVHANRAAAQMGGWNDDFVLRRQFGALIPAFDPRPGRTNINQTQEVELSDNVNFATYKRKGSLLREDSKGDSTTLNAAEQHSQNIRLFIKKASKLHSRGDPQADVLIELKEDDASLFYYVHELLLASQRQNSMSSGGNAAQSAKPLASLSDMNSQIWDHTFTLVYGYQTAQETNRCAKSREGSVEKESAVETTTLVKQTLDLIKILNELTGSSGSIDGVASKLASLPEDAFHSNKLTQKLCQELTDPLVVSAKALPPWCNYLIYHFPCLFSVDTRTFYLNTAAYGTSRAIGFLQGKRDQLLEQGRSATASAGSNMAGLRREDHYPEYRIGRIKHERIKVHRNDELLLDSAFKVLKFHAMRKAILEIEYFGEEGTGLGPTLEFFALVAAEFQRRDLCMWISDDAGGQQQANNDDEAADEHSKPLGFYVHTNSGLFPAPWPQNCGERVLELFQLFGIFLAKAIQDSRLVDLPLSSSFLKLLTSPKLSTGDDPSIESLLDFNDFAQIFPEKAKLAKALIRFVEKSKALRISGKAGLAEELKVEMDGHEFTLEDLSLTFAINPPSKCFPYACIELVENGNCVEVTAENVEDYVKKLVDCHLNTGIREQVIAFRHGFDMVFPLASLIPFKTSELQTLLSGEQSPKWTREDLLRYTEPKLGYTRDSPGFLNLVEVLTKLDAAERKAFLQFTTGCTSLPPGGLANLHPRLTIVRKVGSGDGSYPSVNTCVHYLKLPEYSSAEILKERLMAATHEKGFHLN